MGGRPDGATDPGRLGVLLRELAGELDAMDGAQGWLAALRFGVAGGLADLGEAEIADAGFRRILEGTPTHLWAWIGRIDIALGRADAAAAAAIGREALGHLPSEGLLLRKAAEAVEASEGPGAAIEVLRGRAVDEMNADDLAYAIGLHRGAGRVPEAVDHCARLIVLRPDAAIAHLARIEIGLQTGDAAAAVRAAEAALVQHAEHAEIVLRAAQAYRRAGNAARAIELAGGAPQDDRFLPSILVLRAELAEQQGDAGSALEFWTQIDALGVPDLREAAEAAVLRLRDAVPQKPPAPLLPPRPETTVPEEADAAQLYDALESALVSGSHAGTDGLAAALLARLMKRHDLPWYLALRLVERLWRAGAAAEAAGLAAGFATTAWPEADRQAFFVEDLLLRCGARTALDWVRAHPVGRRDAEASERLGRVLLAAGTGALAARYLRACCHRWPSDGAFLRQATAAMIACGQAEAVNALIEGPAAQAPAAERLGCHVRAALAIGKPDAAVAACRSAGRSGSEALPWVDLIEAQILTGDLAGAEASLVQLSVEDGPLEEALICRPRATRIGTLLNEARILSAMGEDEVGDGQPGREAQAGDFFIAARADLLARTAGPQPDATDGTVPGRLHLVWRGSEATPEERDRLLAAWRGATERDVHLLDPRSCGTWLRDKIGADAARAHAMAPDAEQKGDLVSLALLAVEGGMVFGAEQWPTGDIDALCGSVGTTVFLEGTGGIAMEALIAPPDHPLITTALHMVVAACLARENDHRWFKTGPGMMARALARFHGLADVTASPVTIAPVGRLRSRVHPCQPVAVPPRAPRDAAAAALRTAARQVLAG